MRRLRDRMADMLPSHARESGLVFAGDVFSKFLTFLITVLLLGAVTPSEYALYGVFITVLAAALQFTDSGLHQSLIRFVALYSERNPAKAAAHLRLSWRVKIAGIFVTSILLYIGAPVIADKVFLMPDLRYPLRLMSIGVVAGGVFEYCQAVFQARQKFGLLTLFRVMEGVGKLAFIFAFVALGAFTLEIVYFAYVIAPMLLALAGIRMLQREFSSPEKLNWKETGAEIFSFGKWMMLASFSTMFFMRLDILMLPPLLADKPDDIGHYAAAVRLCTPLIVIVNSVTTVFFPKAMALGSRTEMRAYVKRTFQVTLPLIALSVLYGIGIVLAVPYAFPDYVPSIPLFAILFIGYAWTLFGNPITALVLSINRAKVVAAISFTQLVATAVSHYAFITAYGATGAAISTVLVWFASGSFTLAYLYRHRHEIERREAG